ncbi:hypothetical protein CTEN210_04576 [Chaetoceros tenuissimus]|uniref:Uncharacterized protein n=1 Tax=Chaetoceros tenuissimus TaxID=426638 RepID=A0AAD3CN38_9STRA|nr:hypothetical protein CTEN210_04576 [Chaetoceros tenuissimus]
MALTLLQLALANPVLRNWISFLPIVPLLLPKYDVGLLLLWWETYLKKDEDRKKLVEKVIEICGETNEGLYALVNNAGMEIPGCIAWTKPEVYNTTMQLNFLTPVYLIYELLPPQLKKAKGRIINVSSVAGLVPIPTTVAYSASKCALEGYSDCLRIEMRPFGVQVIIMEPSAMRTPMAQKHVSIYWERENEYTDGYGPRSKEDMKVEIQKQRNSLETKFEDPDIVVRDLMYALMTPKAPARILSRNMENRFFNILHWLPCKWRDSILFRVSLQKHFR